MTITRNDIYSHVRTYFELEAEEMPNSIIDRWVSEGWVRIKRRVPNWPGWESSYVLTVVSGTSQYAFPVGLLRISSVRDATQDGVLQRIEMTEGDRLYPPPVPTGRPTYYSVWQNNIFLWPTPNVGMSLQIRGIKTPAAVLGGSATTAIDLPTDDSEDALLAFVMARACVHQYESEQAAVYQDDFDKLLRDIELNELHAPLETPIVLNSRRAGAQDLPERLRFPWE